MGYQTVFRRYEKKYLVTQEQYDRQLSDYYTQLQQKGEDYNNAYAQDYGQYQDYLSRLDTLHGYYTAQEQAQASRRQQTFNGIMTVLGVIGDAIQLAISGTTGIISSVTANGCVAEVSTNNRRV